MVPGSVACTHGLPTTPLPPPVAASRAGRRPPRRGPQRPPGAGGPPPRPAVGPAVPVDAGRVKPLAPRPSQIKPPTPRGHPPPMIAFTFPGQGSQRPGMGEAWVDHPSWELVAEATEHAGLDIGALLLTADADELVITRNAQLATFVLSLVVLDAIERTGLEPARAAGHSLGEYTAL